jgi:hypothetical protein
VNGTVLVFLHELLAQIPEAGAAVEDIDLPVDADLNAGGVPSVSQIFELGSGSGSPDAPEFHQHELYPVTLCRRYPLAGVDKFRHTLTQWYSACDMAASRNGRQAWQEPGEGSWQKYMPICPSPGNLEEHFALGTLQMAVTKDVHR